MIYRRWDLRLKLKTLVRYKSYWKAILKCPWSDPLHTDKDGCPACAYGLITDNRDDIYGA